MPYSLAESVDRMALTVERVRLASIDYAVELKAKTEQDKRYDKANTELNAAMAQLGKRARQYADSLGQINRRD